MESWREELYHHGILGQKWGVRNGDSYPLKPEQHSSAEKRAMSSKDQRRLDNSIKKYEKDTKRGTWYSHKKKDYDAASNEFKNKNKELFDAVNGDKSVAKAKEKYLNAHNGYMEGYHDDYSKVEKAYSNYKKTTTSFISNYLGEYGKTKLRDVSKYAWNYDKNTVENLIVGLSMNENMNPNTSFYLKDLMNK